MKRSAASLLSWTGTTLFLLVNLAFTLCRVPNDQFDGDEPEHAEIAWLVAQGQIPYRDFWEAHGPLYSLLNGFLIRVADPEPQLGLLVGFRALNACVYGAILVLTYAMARALSLSRLSALAAVAMLSSLFFIQDKVTEFRPDVVQNLFWLAGLWLMLREDAGRDLRRTLLAGMLFALAVMTNAKAAIGPLFVGIAMAGAAAFGGSSWRIAGRGLVGLAAGAAPVYLAFVTYFFVFDSVANFHFSTVTWMLAAAAAERTATRGWEYLRFFLSDQTPFVLLTLAGLALWFRDVAGRAGTLDKERGWLMLVVTIGTTAGWVLNLYTQFFLVFLPLLSIIASFGLTRIAELARQRAGIRGLWLVAVLVVISAGFMIREAGIRATIREHPNLVFQKAATRRLLAESLPGEPVAALWFDCPGYAFRSPLQYYWLVDPGVGRVVQYFSGKDPFGAAFVRNLEERRVRLIVGRDSGPFENLAPETRRYIREGFSYEGCFWRRREAGPVAVPPGSPDRR